MARISESLYWILCSGKEENTCLFCGSKLLEGGMWDIGGKSICVGKCCKEILLKLYKDTFLDNFRDVVFLKNGEISENELEVFKETAIESIDDIIKSEIEIEDSRIKNRRKELDKREKMNIENKRKFNY